MRMILLCSVFCCFVVICDSLHVQTASGLHDLVDISCVNGHTENFVYRHKPDGLRPLLYEAEGSIYGKLAQNIKINGTGDCYDFFIRFR